jgi:hypothetical protein
MVLGLALLVTSAGAQGRTPERRACPSCDSVAAERGRTRTIGALVTELAQHQMSLASLRRRLASVAADPLTLAQRRELETQVAATQAEIAGVERSLLERCGGDSGLPRGSIGAVFMTATDSLRRARHPVVYSVTPGSPAFRAGMVPGDTIILINGRDARTQSPGFLEPGETVEIRLLRDRGQRHDIRVSVAPRSGLLVGTCGSPGAFLFTGPRSWSGFGSRVMESSRTGVVPDHPPETGQSQLRSWPDPTDVRIEALILGQSVFGSSRSGSQVLAGADLHMLNDGLRAALSLAPGDTGAFVLAADSTSPAGVSGLRSGDVIIRAAGQKVRSLDIVVRAIIDAPARRVHLDVLRAPAARPGGDARGQKREEVVVMLRW